MKPATVNVPTGDREALIVPAIGTLTKLVRDNAERLAGCDFAQTRDAAREQIMSAAREYTASLGVAAAAWDGEPIVMTGHQPEFTHPGVWIKNHLCARLARALGAVGLNLVVDGDVPREGELTFPAHAHGAFTSHGVHFARTDSTRAWEEHTDKSSWQFDHLASEVKDLLPVSDASLIIERFMEGVGECMTQAVDIAHLMTLLRRRYEEKIGLGNLEVPASVMCETRAWTSFVEAIAADTRRFATVYNEAVAEYRRVNAVRSSSHPVPDLAIDDEHVELPFWVWTPGGERERLYADDARAGRKVRPRALSNTIFCRLFLSDVFIHGVGGAKYDTITDRIIREYFGVEPPGFITASATVYLPIDVEASKQEDIRRLRWELRDCVYNADRHMPPELRRSARAEALVTEKRKLVSRNRHLRKTGGAQTHRERRDLFGKIRTHNAEMTQLIDDRLAELKEELTRVEHHLGDRDIVQQRGYAFVLYPEEMLLGFYDEAIQFD